MLLEGEVCRAKRERCSREQFFARSVGASGEMASARQARKPFPSGTSLLFSPFSFLLFLFFFLKERSAKRERKRKEDGVITQQRGDGQRCSEATVLDEEGCSVLTGGSGIGSYESEQLGFEIGLHVRV